MSLSTCDRCGGHIPLGPDATNRCEKCGLGVFSPSPPDSAERRAEYWKAEHLAANARIEELETRLRDIGDIAHAQSTGPAEIDWLWRIRELAYELL